MNKTSFFSRLKAIARYQAPSWISWLFVLAVGAMSFHLLWMHWQIIRFPYPLEYRENVDLWRSYLIHTGRNPYSYDNYPAGQSQYGYIFPWLSSWLMGQGTAQFFDLRLTAFLAILPMLVLFVYCGVRERVSSMALFLSVAIVYAVHLLFPTNFLGMPNTLGMSIFAYAVLLPPLLKFSRVSLVITVALSIVGAFTKLYFCLGLFYVGAYVLYTRQWRKVVFLSIVSLLGLVVALGVIRLFLPAFYEANIAMNTIATNWVPKFIWLQARDFVRVFFGFVLLILLARFRGAASLGLKNPYVFGIVFFGLVLLRMAGNDGQYYLYFQHLLLPFLVPLVFQQIGVVFSSSLLVALLLCWNFSSIYWKAVTKFDLEKTENSFRAVEREIQAAGVQDKLLLSNPLSYFDIAQGRAPVEHGQLGGLIWTKGEGHKRFMKQQEMVRQRIRTGYFSEIFTDTWYSPEMSNIDLISACYQKQKQIRLRLYDQDLMVTQWTPSPNLCARS